MLQLQNLSTGYSSRGHRRVLSQGLSCSLPEGELTCLIGPNGCGKTTLLRTVGGFLAPLEGKVLLGGEDAAALDASQMARRVAVVLTRAEVPPYLTVDELVALGRSPYTGYWGALTDADRQAVDRAIAQTEIGALRCRRVSTLSDGERQRAFIAKALAQDTPLLLLDEPSAFLDYPSKVRLMDLLISVARQGHKSVLLSTHDLDIALRRANSLWVMDRMGNLRSGTPEELHAHRLLEEM